MLAVLHYRFDALYVGVVARQLPTAPLDSEECFQIAYVSNRHLLADGSIVSSFHRALYI